MNVRALVSQFDLTAAEVARALRIPGGRTNEPAAARPAMPKPVDVGANGAVVRRSLGRKRCAG
jgi:hypothetical protein